MKILRVKEPGYGRCIAGFFCKKHFICLECRHTVSGVKNINRYIPLCPNGHGSMMQYDDRLRVPKKNSKKWKRFWSITIVRDE